MDTHSIIGVLVGYLLVGFLVSYMMTKDNVLDTPLQRIEIILFWLPFIIIVFIIEIFVHIFGWIFE